MREDARLTFEEAYRAAVADSALYQLNEDDPKADITEVRRAAILDDQAVNNLLETVCKDVGNVIGRQLISGKQMSVMATFHLPFRAPAQHCFNHYKNITPISVNNTLSGIKGNVLGAHDINWVHWEGDHVYTKGAYKKVWKEPAVLAVEDVELPAHIKRIVDRLKKTNFNYEPYVLRCRTGKTHLVLRFGAIWSDLTVADFDKDEHYFVKDLECRMMGAALGALGLTLWIALSWPGTWVAIVCFTLAFLSLIASVAGGMMVYEGRYKPVRL